jgi:protein involved in sex pheromone biosynthesis
MTLKTYIKKCAKKSIYGETPEGDFIADATADKDFKNFSKWEDLEWHLVFRKADQKCLKAAKTVFKHWQAETFNHG